MTNKKLWIGFDLDGTLAHYDSWQGIGHIGEPIPTMINVLRAFLTAGHRCKIFTARAVNGEEQIKHIQDWLEAQGLPRLEVTATKDYYMECFFDDRCFQVETNTGKMNMIKEDVAKINNYITKGREIG